MANGPGGQESRQESEAEARRRRLEALGALAREEQGGQDRYEAGEVPLPSAAQGTHTTEPGSVALRPAIPALAPRPSGVRRRGWRWGALVAGALVVVIVAVVLRAVFAPGAPRHAAASQATLDLGKSGILCPNSVAWSPDGSQVAVVGHSGALCPDPFDGHYTAGAVGIYNVATGKLEHIFQPDDMIEPLLPFAAPTSAGTPEGASADAVQAISGAPQRTISYQGLVWSAVGNRLALPFAVTEVVATQQGNQTNESLQTIVNGLEVVDAVGTNPQVFMLPIPAAAVLWDTRAPAQTSAGTPLPSLPGSYIAVALPPAAGYHWSAGGQLVADAPFGGATPSAPPLGPVGNPAGGASFTLWQPGTATYLAGAYVNGESIVENPGAYISFTDVAAWSPDGRYVIEFNLMDRMQPAGKGAPSAQALTDMGLGKLPVAPVRDKALDAMLTALLPLDQQGRQVQYAWRPSGRVLAARQWPFENQSESAPAGAVHLYDTATGVLLATLTPASRKGPIFQGNDDVVWSPDGSHLLAVDAASGLVTIWGSGALPQ